MSFRIRADADASDYAGKEKIYRAHLDQIKSGAPPDLWRYFAVDVFHDGRIENINLGPNTEISIWCPNIRITGQSKEYVYVNALFHCEFRDVFSAEYSAASGDPSVDEVNDPLSGLDRTNYFSYAEIDSLDHKIRAAETLRNVKYHSLVIQLRPAGFELSLVFAGLTVKPDEPLAFSLMSSDPRYRLPNPDNQE
jgi:hypothetical protein